MASFEQVGTLPGGTAAGRPARPGRRLGRPPGVDGEDTVKRILGVAERQFATVGYAAATNKTISDECGLSTAAIYHHIGTKIALYRAVSETVYPSMIDAFREALGGLPDFRARFGAILEESIRLNQARPSLAGFVMGAPVEARRHPELREIVDQYFGRIEQFVGRLVDEARMAGELDPRVATADIVDTMLSIMHGLAHLAYRDDSTDKHARVVQTIERLLDGRLITGPPGSPAAIAALGKDTDERSAAGGPSHEKGVPG
jgi:AcrR family transcriptional regulator